MSILATIVLLRAIAQRRWTLTHWIIFLLLVANVTLLNRGVVGGYDWGSALSAGSHFTPVLLLLLLAWLLPRLDPGGKLELGVVGILSIMLLIPLNSPEGHDASLWGIAQRLPEKNRIVIPVTWVRSSHERVGPLYLPAEQESAVSEVTSFLKGTTSFWDFTDHGLYFFLSDHSSPTRFYKTHQIVTWDNQREVIADLARTRPQYILYRSRTGWDAIEGVDRTIRDPLVSEYVLRNYRPYRVIGGFDVLEQGAPEAYPTGAPFRVDLGYVSLLWGENPAESWRGRITSTVAEWSFAADGDRGNWQVAHDVLAPKISEPGWHLRTAGQDPQLVNFRIDLDPRAVTYLVLNMTVGPCGKVGQPAQFLWRSDEDGFAEERSLFFGIVCDNQEHAYWLRLAAFPSWMWSKPITGLRLDPGERSDVDVTVQTIRLIQVME